MIPKNATVLNVPINVIPVKMKKHVPPAQPELTEILNLPLSVLVKLDIMKTTKIVSNVLTNAKPVNLLLLVLNVKRTEDQNQIVIVKKDIGKTERNVTNVQSSVKLVLLVINVLLVPPN
jgi:hypothetical protein